MEFGEIIFNKPSVCKLCKGRMIFKGVGEYRCEDCLNLEYDDYGKVRNYIENKHGATMLEIENAVNVKQKVIRQMLKEERFEITSNSNVFMICEACGKEIRSGKLCHKCSSVFAKKQGDLPETSKNIKGIAKNPSANSVGEKRFKR